MTTFDEKPKAVRTSITVTVNYCYRQQHYNGLLNSVDNTKKKKSIALLRTLSSKYAFFPFISAWHNFVRLVWIEGRPRGLPKVVALEHGNLVYLNSCLVFTKGFFLIHEQCQGLVQLFLREATFLG